VKDGWNYEVSDAPVCGQEFIGLYGKDECTICWSDNPICMLGARNGSFPAGWATAGGETDNNLPMSEPDAWKEI